jgi:ribosomal 50S subunit-associated protein YjgA (DUF615 family)
LPTRKVARVRVLARQQKSESAEDLPFPDFETVYQHLKTVYEEEDKSDDTLTEVL